MDVRHSTIGRVLFFRLYQHTPLGFDVYLLLRGHPLFGHLREHMGVLCLKVAGFTQVVVFAGATMEPLAPYRVLAASIADMLRMDLLNLSCYRS